LLNAAGQFMGANNYDNRSRCRNNKDYSNNRAPFSVKLGKIWPYLNIPGTCWYPVSSDEQGRGVIEGDYTDYIVDDLLFANNFKYSQLKY